MWIKPFIHLICGIINELCYTKFLSFKNCLSDDVRCQIFHLIMLWNCINLQEVMNNDWENKQS